MNKFELVKKLAERESIDFHYAKSAVDLIFNSMTDSLVKGNGFQIRGFCSFKIREYEKYVGQNPKTGEKIKIKSKKLPYFRCGKDLSDRINKKGAK